MNKEMAERAEAIVERHVNELTLQLENMALTDDQYVSVVDTLSKLSSVQIMQVTLRIQNNLYSEAGE